MTGVNRPLIVILHSSPFHELFAEEMAMRGDIEIVQASITPKPVFDLDTYTMAPTPKANEPWYRQFDKKRKK